MKIICAPEPRDQARALSVVLYGRAEKQGQGSIGAAVAEEIHRQKWVPSSRAWDFLSIALSAIAADSAGHRTKSPDGWTREFDVEVATLDPAFWETQRETLQDALAFLTTDRWQLRFTHDGYSPLTQRRPVWPEKDSVVLLSGGLDSLIGTIDLAASRRSPLAVSQTVRGDSEIQQLFASLIGGGLAHLQLNHNIEVPDPENPPSQRARSIVFLAYGVLVGSCTGAHSRGEQVPLYVCENGFIALNPPLTSIRIGSLSTRTAHPRFLRAIQRVLDASGLHMLIANPYELTTKGEMLAGCKDQDLIAKLASQSTSCGRYRVFGYRHCGRCMPCQIRRAAFLHAGLVDRTDYVFKNLGKNDKDHRAFDDVRASALAIAEVASGSFDKWLGACMAWANPTERLIYQNMIERGLEEIATLHTKYGVK